MNNNVAIWSREKELITNEEYQKFYKAISKETVDAKTWIHFKAEGEVVVNSVLLLSALEVRVLIQSYSPLVFSCLAVRWSSSAFCSSLEKPQAYTKTTTTARPA